MLGRAAALFILLAAATAPAQALGLGDVLVVNRARVIEASRPAQALRETERQIRAAVEQELERVKAELEAEEQELTRLKDVLPAAQFEQRTRDFDRRVRQERRAAQERGALIIRFLDDASAALRSALPRVLEALRRERGAAVLIDSAAVLAADPSVDVTDEAIARYNAAMGAVTFDPPPELLAKP